MLPLSALLATTRPESGPAERAAFCFLLVCMGIALLATRKRWLRFYREMLPTTEKTRPISAAYRRVLPIVSGVIIPLIFIIGGLVGFIAALR